MPKEKPGIPKGTRDFNPLEIARREMIFSQIRRVFELHGFRPIETPAMENLSTLMGKYGEEGDRLIFRILNSGDFPARVSDEEWQSRDAARLSARICDKALRYDLTVPFARFVVQHQHQISFPFRRYQIQPVWRADRPQKGRYREFVQCDADVIGSDSLVNEAGFMQIIGEVFSSLGLNVEIRINNRKILAGLADYIGHPDRMEIITTAIDKIEKIGMDEVCNELLEQGLNHDAIEKLKPVLLLPGTNASKLEALSGLLQGNQAGMQGIAEIREVLDIVAVTPTDCELTFDLTLARGLNYYTGAIIEVRALDVPMGSICGGGRYDNLTGIFGLEGVSGIGISFGADRIYDVMISLGLFPDAPGIYSQLLAVNFGPRERDYCLPLLSQLRAGGVRCEMYPGFAKVKKQLQYADKNGIPFVLMAGEEEMKSQLYSLKNMQSGEQKTLPASGVIEELAREGG